MRARATLTCAFPIKDEYGKQCYPLILVAEGGQQGGIIVQAQSMPKPDHIRSTRNHLGRAKDKLGTLKSSDRSVRSFFSR